MSKYNINIDPKLPTKDETKSFQNFDSIIGDIQNIHKPSYVIQNIHKNFKLVKILILITIILMTLYVSIRPSKQDLRPKDIKKQVKSTSFFETKSSTYNL